MAYAIADVDLTKPLPTVSLALDETGLALLVRRDERPVSFILHELPPATVLEPSDLAKLIADRGAVDLVEDALRSEMVPGGRSAPASVTIAICTRARAADLAECLASVRAVQDGQRNGFVEVLVVDNDPPDSSTRELVASLPDVRYVHEPRPGLDFARNAALREAAGDFVAFLDDDVVVDRLWLAGLEEALGEQPDAAVVTGLVLPRELATKAQVTFERRGGFRRGFRKLRYHGQRLPHNPLYPCGAGIFGAGCNMAVRKEVARRLGGFDEALDMGRPLPGGGDLDMFYRVIRSGYPLVYEPGMMVFHRHRRDYDALRRQYWTWGTGFMAFVSKSYSRDPSQRLKLRRLIRWWYADQLAELVRSLGGRSVLSPDLVLAELAGGTVGLAGTYARSVRRADRIRRRFR